MPGVVISTSVRTGPSVTLFNQASQAFFVGKAERGPATEAVLVLNLEQFEDLFGGFMTGSNLHPTVEAFFEEGGTQCYVARVVGPAATVGLLGLLDASPAAGGAAAIYSIIIKANGPGAWSNTIDVQVTSGTLAGTFQIKVFRDDIQIATTGNCTTREQAVGKLNLHAEASKYITAFLGTDTGVPVTLAATALSAGSDDLASVTAAHLVTALTLFNDALGTGAVACPENQSDAVMAGLIAHANEYNRIAVLHTDQDTTIAQAKVWAQEVVADNSNLEHAALYYPWVLAPTAVEGLSRTIPPDGYVCGKRSRTLNTAGAHIPNAGSNSESSFIVGVAVDIDRTNGNALDDDGVNAIRIINNSVRIYGARSLSQDTTNFRYITAQDIVNAIVTDAYRAIEPIVFSPIDGRGGIFSAVEARLISVLEGYRIGGSLFEAFSPTGARIDYGYTVRCDAKLNPTTDLANGKVRAKVGVRVSSIGDRIEVEIVKSSLTASVTA